MNCGLHRETLIELARGGELAASDRARAMVHAEHCDSCAQLLDRQLALTALLKEYAAEEIPDAAEFEGAVMAAFDRAQSRDRMRKRAWWAVASAAAAAAVVLALVVRPAPPATRIALSNPRIASAPALVQEVPREHAPQPAPVKHPVIAARSTEEQPFLTIPYTVPLAPEERATVSRMSIPVTALIAAGFNVQGSDPGAEVEADVLVSQDGRARAIRSLSLAITRPPEISAKGER